MKGIFITGTDTGVGKTLISGLLLDFLREQEICCGYQKWVSTGGETSSADRDYCVQVADLPQEPDILDLQVPYRFAYPASPHFAGELEGKKVEEQKILAAYQEMSSRYNFLVVEGVGGLLVPLRRDLLLADLLARMNLPVLIVARSGLGTLNHTFLTIEALRARKVDIFGVVCSDGQDDPDARIVADNLKTIAEIGGVRVFGRLPYCSSLSELKEEFQPLGQAIFESFQAASVGSE